MKRFLTVTLILVLVFSLAACGSNQSAGSKPAASSDTVAEKMTWKVASQSADNVLFAKMLKDIASEVAKRTDGGFELKVYTNAALGSDREIAEGVQSGIIDAGQVTNAVLANFCPEVGVTDIPYLIPDWESAKIYLKSDVMDIQKKALQEKGFYSLGNVCYGFRQCTNNIRPINTLEDFVGIKFRVMQNDIYIATFKALGAYPVGMAKAELVTALQQHTVDGQENPMEINFNEGMPDVQKYLSKTSHVAGMAGFVANPKAFAALPAKYQKVLVEVFDEYTLKTTDEYEKQEDLYAQKLVDAGMQYNTVSEENLTKFREVCMTKVWPQFESKYADQLAIIKKLF